nr:hypothetical protein [Tanacetum cinerariifolium]
MIVTSLKTEFLTKVIDDVGEDEDFKGRSWVSSIEFVNANSGGIVNACLGDIENYLKNEKLKQVIPLIKSCTPNALGDLAVTLKDLSGGSGMSDEEKIMKLLEEEEMADLELQVC